MSDDLTAVLRALIPHNSRNLLQFTLVEQHSWDKVPGRSGQQIHDALRELKSRGWIEGDWTTGDGSYVIWSKVRPTVPGLRHIGEWPHQGQEYLEGPWTQGTWGKHDFPLLEHLHRSQPDGDFIFKPDSMDASERIAEWSGYLRLLEADLIDGQMEEGGLPAFALRKPEG